MYLYRSNRLERLADALADLLRVPLADPLQPEIVVVQSRGLESWLRQQLAQRLGICANLDFAFPARILQRLLVPADSHPEHGSKGGWQPELLVWNILAVLPGLLPRPEFAPLRLYLGASAREAPDAEQPAVSRRAWQLARRLAELFDRYITYRPELVLEWDRRFREQAVAAPPRASAGLPLARTRLVERSGRATPGSAVDWQEQLWLALRARLPPDQVPQLAQRVEAGPWPDHDLPARVCFFGLSTLPPFYLELLRRLGERTAVQLFVLCPSQEYWGCIRSRREIARELWRNRLQLLGEEELHLDEGNPLLASFGRLGRDFQLVLEGLEAAQPYEEPCPELFVDPAPATPPPASAVAPGPATTQPAQPTRPTLLQVLQSDILRLRHRGRSGPPDQCPPRLAIGPGDDSLQVHVCHGPMRQVEVLRDELLGLLNADPTLQPREIVIMAPELETFAPLIAAVLADGSRPGAEEPGFPPLPFRIADRSLRRDNPVASALLALLGLARSRLPASALLDLLARAPVRRRFGLGEAELVRIRGWVADSGIRWGLDAEDRRRHGQPAYQENSWRFGLERLLLGHGLVGAPGQLFRGVLPCSEIEGEATATLGQFAEFCEQLFAALERLQQPRSMAAWQLELTELLDRLLLVDDEEGWIRQEVLDGLAELTAQAVAAGHDGLIAPEALEALLDGQFALTAGWGGAGGGGITVCSLAPLRGVPFRVVCLLGLDDGKFPSSAEGLAFDQIALHPRIGDRSLRDEERMQFLEALLAARERLIITYEGRGLRDNQPKPPAVPLGELLDVVAEGFGLAGPDGALGPIRDLVVREHPLQPFSPQHYDPAARGERHLSFDRRWLAGTRRLTGARSAPPPFVRGPLTASAPESVPEPSADGPTSVRPRELLLRVDELRGFWQGPLRHLLNQRLGLELRETEDTVADREPVQLSGLEGWSVGQTLLEARLADAATPCDFDAIRAMGRLPLGTPGRCNFEEIRQEVEQLVQLAAPCRRGQPRTLAVDLRLGATRLVGELGGLWEGGPVRHHYARLKYRQLLTLWIDHLIMTATDPDWSGSSIQLGRSSEQQPDGCWQLPPLAPDPPTRAHRSRELLTALVDRFWQGQALPLLFFPETSWAYATEARRGPDLGKCRAAARLAAARCWAPYEAQGEGEDPYVVRVLGTAQPFAADFQLPGCPLPPELSFHALALQIWGPVLELLG